MQSWLHRPASMSAMSTVGERESRRRLVRLLIGLASPVILIVAVAGVVVWLKAHNETVRWSAVSQSCPKLTGEAAAVLLVDAEPMPGGNGLDPLTLHDCQYSDEGDLMVSVILHKGSAMRSSHGAAVRAFKDNPPVTFRPIGSQDGDGWHFGDAGAQSDQLILISVVDNAEVRVLFHHQGLLAEATDVTRFRAPLQAVADQAITNLG